MAREILVVADQHAGNVRFLDPLSGRTISGIDHVVLAEHAGILELGGGRCAFVDDAGGAVLLADPFRQGPVVTERVSVAIPGEHLACDPAGRFLAVSTGLGRAWEPWSELLTVVDLEADGGARSRRIRTRPGEPGVVVAETPDGPHAVVRHREPGAIESLPLADILEAGGHCPPLRGNILEEVSPDGHGDAYDPLTGTMFVATDRGMERFDVRKGEPQALPAIPWEAPGRAYFLRFCPRRRILAAVLRDGGLEPAQWTSWRNAFWVHHIDSGSTRTAPLGDGLVFRFALTATAAAIARIHPDGDDLTVVDLVATGAGAARAATGAPAPVAPRLRGTWPLPPMDQAPRAGHEPWDNADRRAIAASPSSELVAVTRGGHGELHFVDTADPGSALRTVATEGPLRDGGHLGWLSADLPAPRDTVGR